MLMGLSVRQHKIEGSILGGDIKTLWAIVVKNYANGDVRISWSCPGLLHFFVSSNLISKYLETQNSINAASEDHADDNKLHR